MTIGEGVQVDSHDLPCGRPLEEFAGTLAELEDCAANGGFDDCILKARVVSGDPIPDLADRLAEWSPDCAVFELVNVIENQPVTAIDPDSESREEPGLEELFVEWRTTSARGITAPHDTVATLFAQALGGVGQETRPDFGLTPLASGAQEVLDRLASDRSSSGG